MIASIYLFSVIATMYLCIAYYEEIVVFAGLNLFNSEKMKERKIEDTEKNKFRLLHQYMFLAILVAPLTLCIVLISKMNDDKS